MKKFISFAAAGLLLAGCTQEEQFTEVENLQNAEIAFSLSTPAVTRALSGSDAAAKLGNNFVVYGYKIGKDVEESADGKSDQKVFMRYNVNYKEGTANTTKSNTAGWEYVGYTSLEGKEQTIKYWDFGASKYVFSAVSFKGTDDIAPTKIEYADDIYGKGWKFSVPKGGSLSDLYGSARTEITKSVKGSDATYSYETVNLKFYSLVSKIRFAIYETIPGYTVKIDKFYYGSTSSTDNFAVDGTFKGLNALGTTDFTLTYYDNNKPKLNYGEEVSVVTSMTFGANLPSSTAIGTASNTATYDQANGEYTCILPYESLNETEESKKQNVLQLKMDYTLVSTDDSEEEIKVYGATASVPTSYTQWKENYAYTYIFKISDNTSGKPGDDDPKTPSGLYPITFDACIENTSDDVQESITTVSDPSITTWQNGAVVTTQDGYNAGNIEVAVYDATSKSVTLSKSNLKLYTAYSTDGTTLSEKSVENYVNNGIVLTDVSTALSFNDKIKIATFSAVAGQTYIAEYTQSDKKYYKVIQVAGTRANVVYKFEAYKEEACETDLDKIEEGGLFYVTAQQVVGTVEYAVTGAAKNFSSETLEAFTVEETSTPGKYKFTAKAGTNGDQKIKINETGDNEAGVDIKPFEFSSTSVNVIADAVTEATITLNLNGSAATDVDAATNFEVTKGLTIKSVADGKVTLIAAKDAESGTIKYKNNDIVVATADVNVQHYSFVAVKNVINIGSSEAADKSTKLTLKLAGSDAGKDVAVTSNVGTANGTTVSAKTDDDSQITVNASVAAAIGNVTVTAPDDNKITIEVTNFKVTVSGETVTFTNNGNAENASLTVSAGTLTKTAVDGQYTWKNATSGATIKYTYKGVTFTLYQKS